MCVCGSAFAQFCRTVCECVCVSVCGFACLPDGAFAGFCDACVGVCGGACAAFCWTVCVCVGVYVGVPLPIFAGR